MENQPLSNDLQRYIGLLMRWAWLLILGLALGAGAAYIFSTYQPRIFQTTTKIMFTRPPEDRYSEYTALNDIQLAKTFSQLITTDPVLEQLSERIGFQVRSRQITTRQLTDSLILEISVQDGDPQRAALIANSLVEVFTEYNESLQASRFAAAEESLQAQIDQVDQQISSLQVEMGQINQENLESQKSYVEEQVSLLESQMDALKNEIYSLSPTTPEPTGDLLNRSAGRSTSPTESPFLSTGEPTLSPVARGLLEEKQTQLSQLQQRYALYQQIYINLLVLGEPMTAGATQSLRLSQLQNTLNLYQEIYSNLLNSYENIRLARLQGSSNVVQIERAQVPSFPILPQPIRNALLGGVTGLMIMGMIAFLVEYSDDTLRLPEDVTRDLGLPILGIITRHASKDGKPIVLAEPRSSVSEAFRSLRTNIQYTREKDPLKTILVTSSMPGEGKTTVAVNLGVVLAQNGLKVLLLDADLRRPKIHKLLAIHNGPGFSELLTKEQPDLNINIRSTEAPGLFVLTSGILPPNPAELLGSEKMSKSLGQLSEHFDVIILDSPPSLAVTDAYVLATAVDGVVLVIKPGETKRGSAYQAVEQLHRVGAKVLGVVLNDVIINRPGYNGYYKRYFSAYNRYYWLDTANKSNGKEPRLRKETLEQPVDWTKAIRQFFKR